MVTRMTKQPKEAKPLFTLSHRGSYNSPLLIVFSGLFMNFVLSLFVCLWFFVPLENFHSNGDVTIAGEGLQILNHVRNSWPYWVMISTNQITLPRRRRSGLERLPHKRKVGWSNPSRARLKRDTTQNNFFVFMQCPLHSYVQFSQVLCSTSNPFTATAIILCW